MKSPIVRLMAERLACCARQWPSQTVSGKPRSQLDWRLAADSGSDGQPSGLKLVRSNANLVEERVRVLLEMPGSCVEKCSRVL